jgi:quinol-cytochrome oxidoreductase complex cytochrome b subunit
MRQATAMISGIVLIFAPKCRPGPPLPFAGWRIFLTEFAFPTSKGSRLAAVIKLWLGGSVMVSAVINLLYAVLNYSPVRPGLSPTARFLLAGLVLCMFASYGVWGALAPPSARRCNSWGFVTGALLFVAVTMIGFLVSR